MDQSIETIPFYHDEEQFHSNPPPSSSPHVSRVKKLLSRRMLVAVKDGRYFAGYFYCMDKQGNILLQDAVEYRSTRRSSPSPMEERCLGLILIPSSCQSSCHVDCSVEERTDLNGRRTAMYCYDGFKMSVVQHSKTSLSFRCLSPG